MKKNKHILLVVIGLLAPILPANALTVSPSVGVSMEYTDNAKLSATNEEDDWIASGSLSVGIEETGGGPLELSISGSVNQEHYLNDSYGDQTDLNLGANAVWEQLRNRLSWQVSDYLTQTSVDSLGATTPDNSQNTNAFSLGADIIIPISARNRLTVNPVFRDYSYSKTDTDNQSYGLSAAWQYSLYPTMSTGLIGTTTKTEYDDETANPGYTSSSLQAYISGTGARTSYSISLGANQTNRDDFEDVDGAIGSASLLYQLTGRTSIDARISSNLTDSSSNYYRSRSDPNSGSTSGQQVSSDVQRTNIFRITLSRSDPVMPGRAWLEYQEDDYEEASIDRESQLFGVDLRYIFNSRMSAGAYVSYDRTEDTDQNRTDKRYIVGGDISYRLSRSLSAGFDLRYENEDSTNAVDDYDEFRGALRLVYGFGRQGSTPRTGRQSRY